MFLSCLCMCLSVCYVSVFLHLYVCHGNLMSVHCRASQITSEKLAIVDCNCFIKSTMN